MSKFNFPKILNPAGLAALVLALPLGLFSQNTGGKITMADAILKGRTTLAPANLKQLKWVPGTAEFTHVVGRKICRVQAASLKADSLDWLPQLNAGMAKIGLDTLKEWKAVNWLDREHLWFSTGKDILTFSPAEGLAKINAFPEAAENTDFHEKTGNVAYVLGKQLWVNADAVAYQIAESEEDGIVYGKSVHRDEYGITKGTFWSPSGRRLAFYRMDERAVTQYPIYELDSMPAQVRQIRYPYAGAASHTVTIGVFSLDDGKTIYLETGATPDQYLTNVEWSPDNQFVTVAVLNRATNHLWFKQFEAATGKFVRTVFEETNDKWLEPQHPAFFIPGRADEFLWLSQRDGFEHLYRYNLKGEMLGQISRGNFPVTAFYGFDAGGTACFFQTADETAMNRILWKSDLKTGKMTRLNVADGLHNGQVNSTGEWLLDNFSDLTTPRVIECVDLKKQARQVVFKAKNPLENLSTGQIQFLKIPSPGGTSLNARMILPPDFDPKKRYPALVYLYNGPHVQLVANGWLGTSELWMHRMAQEGTIIFSIDGRGSANRGLAFEQAIHRQLGTAEIADQVAGAKYLRAQAFVDSTRMGIFGWSYGGFMTTSMMTRPEAKGLFKAGVAGGPVIDWKMYEIMYTERYMDTPQENPEGYAKASLFNNIDNLDGRLLMIHGSSDDVVLWQHSLRYIREAVKKGKQLDYFVYPEHLHNVLGKDRVHLFNKIEAFFQDNLRVKTP